MQVKGKISRIGETETVGSKGFKKRELVLVTDEKYPQTLSIEFLQNATSLIDNYREGQNVTIDINLRGREWKEKVFNSIVGWKIEAEKTEPAF